MKANGARCILFLVDRRALAAQAVRAFASFDPARLHNGPMFVACFSKDRDAANEGKVKPEKIDEAIGQILRHRRFVLLIIMSKITHHASADEPLLRDRTWIEQQWDLARLSIRSLVKQAPRGLESPLFPEPCA